MSRAWKGLERVVARQGEEVPEAPCGHCGARLDRASIDTGQRPEPGDISICWGCAGVNRFDERLRLEALSDDAVRELDVDHRELEEGRALIRAALLGSSRRPRVDA